MPQRPDEVARKISDRHFGVGSDGLILICPSEVADARMRVFNADGSEAEMCGNGVRCVAKYVYDHGICRNESLRIETLSGVVTPKVELAEGRIVRVKVDMGEPILDPANVGVQFPERYDGDRIVDFPVGKYIPFRQSKPWMADSGWDPRMTCVRVGNPHVVLFAKVVAAIPLETLGPFLERQPIFPKRNNVHFAQVDGPGEVTMRTWERGSGVTLACGSGACSVCVAGALSGRTQRKILAHLPGGDIELNWADDNHIHMTGPAVEVFSGEWE